MKDENKMGKELNMEHPQCIDLELSITKPEEEFWQAKKQKKIATYSSRRSANRSL